MITQRKRESSARAKTYKCAMNACAIAFGVAVLVGQSQEVFAATATCTVTSYEGVSHTISSICDAGSLGCSFGSDLNFSGLGLGLQKNIFSATVTVGEQNDEDVGGTIYFYTGFNTSGTETEIVRASTAGGYLTETAEAGDAGDTVKSMKCAVYGQ